MRQTKIQKLIAALDAEIAVLQAARARLAAFEPATPSRRPRPPRPVRRGDPQPNTAVS